MLTVFNLAQLSINLITLSEFGFLLAYFLKSLIFCILPRELLSKIFTLCLVLATHKLDVNGVIRKKLGTKKASFAGGEETENITGMIVGGVTPFGLPSPLPIWIDEAVMELSPIPL